jgi:hypothetical protein
MNQPTWTPGKIALVLLPATLLTLLAISVTDITNAQQLFVHTTYYFLLATVLCWSGTYLHAARDVRRETVVAWVKENWPGLVIAVVVTVIAGLAVHPALRILSDEANLVGTSKNFFASKTATFTVSGKNYYDSYWDIDVAIDRRPTLFPFLVSLIHAVCGYSYRNVFLFNLMVLPVFVLVSYRLAKSLGGESFAVVASLLVAAHPITLITVRSGSFDFLAVFLGLLVIKSLLDYCRESSPAQLAILWMNLCAFAEVRYETGLFIAPLVVLLLLFRMVAWNTLRPYAFIYALTPAYLLPRIWQAVLRGNVPEQDPGTVTFSLGNFFNNAHDYFRPILSPFQSYPAHSAIVIALGVIGCILWLRWIHHRVLEHDWASPQLRFAIFVSAWMLLQAIVVFTYVWGRAQYPSAARLVIPLDTFFSFAAAWVLTLSLKRCRPFVAVLFAAGVLAVHVPVAAQHRMLNRLTQTRESATTWRFFENLHEKRILVVTDRPNLFTIMDYGAMNFETARHDPYIFTAFDRHLFYDIYVVQQVSVFANEPLPGYELWPTHKLETVLEFQNDANVLIRISRLAHEKPTARQN